MFFIHYRLSHSNILTGRFRALIILVLVFSIQQTAGCSPAGRSAAIIPGTPEPERFAVRGTVIVDRSRGGSPVFFRGIGYSPYLPGETPQFGASPGDDNRYGEHFERVAELGVNYLHVFPLFMPPGFFRELDRSNLVYGQDIWVWGYAEDFLDPVFQGETLARIRAVIDHTYAVGRPDRLVLFSIGDELQAEAVTRTDARHPEVRGFTGRHVKVAGRTPTEVALARLIDGAMDYELTRYGRRHLYCHTSWTHIGPLADRPDLEVARENVLVPDLGDLLCLNVYTYARGVRTSPPGSVTGTAYQGYLEELAAAVDKPVLITQAGLSTSPIAPKPWVPGFGGHRVEDVPAVLRAVWQDVRTAAGREKFAGLVFFELHDEWWKSGEYPADSSRHEADDPEEWFGLYEVGDGNRLIPKGKIAETVRTLFAEP
ncbi:MAG: hypothetical protein RBR09_12845 [Desulfobulbaceae bacterium]|jgi:hypothetical protein|nr:hypothetical protein [Desulfobulbaceae bacterium]MDY0352137.1 hypothetical protein [Desulfobulbaceae bacterium]